jgi:hypothetical protein
MGEGVLMNDLHKHFTAKVLRKNFIDTERLLRDIRHCLNHPPLTPPLKGGEKCGGFPIEEGEILDGFHRKV